MSGSTTREIKFRVWGVDVNGDGEAKMYVVDDIRDTDYARREFNYLEDEDISELNPWMQYTGLKDKNGVEIYEGDILKTGDKIYSENWPVAFKDGSFVMELNGATVTITGQTQVEVIGNIWEAPGLVEHTELPSERTAAKGRTLAKSEEDIIHE